MGAPTSTRSCRFRLLLPRRRLRSSLLSSCPSTCMNTRVHVWCSKCWHLNVPLCINATRRRGCAGDWKVWHGATEFGVMGSGIAVYLAARQVRLRYRKSSDRGSCPASETDIECAGSSDANSKAGAPVRAAVWWRSGCFLCKSVLPSIGVMSAGLLLAAGPHVGHTLAPWRWPKQPTGAASCSSARPPCLARKRV